MLVLLVLVLPLACPQRLSWSNRTEPECDCDPIGMLKPAVPSLWSPEVFSWRTGRLRWSSAEDLKKARDVMNDCDEESYKWIMLPKLFDIPKQWTYPWLLYNAPCYFPLQKSHRLTIDLRRLLLYNECNNFVKKNELLKQVLFMKRGKSLEKKVFLFLLNITLLNIKCVCLDAKPKNLFVSWVEASKLC